MTPLLKPNAIDEELDDYLKELVLRFCMVAEAGAADLMLYSHELGQGDRHFTVGVNPQLEKAAAALIAAGTADGAPLIRERLGAEDSEHFDLKALRAAGVEAVLVYPLQLDSAHSLGRIVALSTRCSDDVLSGNVLALLEALAIQATLAVEAHERGRKLAAVSLRLRDFQHRLANLLGGVIVDMERHIDVASNELFIKSLARLRAFADLSGIISGSRYVGYDLVSLAETVSARTLGALGAFERVSFVADGPFINLSLKQLAALAAVISELVTNSVKYAWPDGLTTSAAIRIEIEERADNVVIRYVDNGRGLAPQVPSTKTGLTLIAGLLAEIEGRAIYDPAAPGFPVVITFPK